MWTSASGACVEEAFVGVDAAPADGDAEHACGLAPRATSYGESPTYAGVGGIGVESPRAPRARGSGSGLCRSVSSAPINDVHEPRLSSGNAVERESDGAEALRRDDPEPSALAPQPPGGASRTSSNASSSVVERLVVQAVGLHELVDPVGIEVAHLGDQAGPADRGPHAAPRPVSRPSTASDACFIEARMIGPESIQRAVEVEQDDAEAHVLIVARGLPRATIGHSPLTVCVRLQSDTVFLLGRMTAAPRRNRPRNQNRHTVPPQDPQLLRRRDFHPEDDTRSGSEQRPSPSRRRPEPSVKLRLVGPDRAERLPARDVVIPFGAPHEGQAIGRTAAELRVRSRSRQFPLDQEREVLGPVC